MRVGHPPGLVVVGQAEETQPPTEPAEIDDLVLEADIAYRHAVTDHVRRYIEGAFVAVLKPEIESGEIAGRDCVEVHAAAVAGDAQRLVGIEMIDRLGAREAIGEQTRGAAPEGLAPATTILGAFEQDADAASERMR